MRSIEKTDTITRGIAVGMRAALLHAAELTIVSRSVEAKIMLGEHLQELAELLRTVEARRNDLLLQDAFSAAIGARNLTGAAPESRKSDLLGLGRAYAELQNSTALSHDLVTARVLDAPTLRILERVGTTLRTLHDGLQRFLISAAAALEVGTSTLHGQLPEFPGRDRRFAVGDNRKARVAPPPGDPLATQFHGLLMSIEIPTIEACAENVLYAEGLPLEFICDMCRQAHDEARHAQSLVHWLDARGIALGTYYISFDLWDLTRRRALVDRLCLHQRLGETIGASAAHWWSQKFAASGSDEESQMYDVMYRDEVQHVAIGNRWITHLCGGDIECIGRHVNAAQAIRAEFQSAHGVVNGQRNYPLPVHALAAAGYTPAEIERMALQLSSGDPNVN